jgi:isopenicillin N synthase-like dioxygenase
LSLLPVFNIGNFFQGTESEKINLGREIDSICKNTGFIALQNHGVPKQIIDNVWNDTQNFFYLPNKEKNKIKPPFEGYPYGYIGLGKEALAASKGVVTPTDLKESFNGGPLIKPKDLTNLDALSFCYADTIWPDKPDSFRTSWEAYYNEMEKLAARVMVVFTYALGIESDFFAKYIDNPISALRALNYPEQRIGAEENQLRAGAHSDYGSLTILLPQEGSTGLEILSPTNVWESVPTVPNTFIINIGDLMAMWTNDRWVSTLHRVVNSGSKTKRQSLAYFHQPNWSAEITCLSSCLGEDEEAKYPTTLSGPYLMEKFKSTNR